MSIAFARLVVRARVFVIVAWIAAAVAVTLALPTIRQAQVGALGDLVPNDATAIEAERRSNELFGFPLISRTLVVERRGQGLSLERRAEVAAHAARVNLGRDPGLRSVAGALPVSNAFGRPPFSRERSTTAVTFLFFEPDIGQIGRTGLARRFAEERAGPLPGGSVGVTGAIPARYEQARVIEDALPWVELATVVMVAAAVALYFRAPGAPLLALATVAIAYLICIRLIAWIGERVGVSVPSEVEPVIVALLFGVITDYMIFFTSRFRRLLREGLDARAAAERTTAGLAPIIVTCALTVALGSAALVVADLGFFQAFGPGMAMAVLVALAVSITFVPAVLALAGGAILWPSARRGDERGMRTSSGRPSVTARLIDLAVRRPGRTVLACLALLAVASSGLLELNLGNSLIRGLPAESEPRRAYAAGAQGFAPGILSPTVIVVERTGVARRRAALARLQRALDRFPGVAEVIGPGSNPTRASFGAVLSRGGDAARYVLVLGNDPLGSRAIATVDRLGDRMPELLASAGLPRASASIAGDTALSAETIDNTVDDLARVIPAVMAVVVLVLVVFLRGLVAPLYLVAASLLAPLAAVGLATYVFGDIRDYGELTYFVPVAAGVLLIALGSDYNVFLAGRVWQEAKRRPLLDAVRVGGKGAAGAISAAGLVLAGSFALLALVPLRSFRELAFVTTVGLLIDAFVVRTVLVPAAIALVGERSGWPGHRLRRRRQDPLNPGGPPTQARRTAARSTPSHLGHSARAHQGCALDRPPDA